MELVPTLVAVGVPGGLARVDVEARAGARPEKPLGPALEKATESNPSEETSSTKTVPGGLPLAWRKAAALVVKIPNPADPGERTRVAVLRTWPKSDCSPARVNAE